MLREFQHKMLTRTSLDRLLHIINGRRVSTDGKIETIHGNFVILGYLMQSCRHDVSAVT